MDDLLVDPRVVFTSAWGTPIVVAAERPLPHLPWVASLYQLEQAGDAPPGDFGLDSVAYSPRTPRVLFAQDDESAEHAIELALCQLAARPAEGRWVPASGSATAEPPALLSARQLEVAELIHDGQTNEEIAAALGIARRTVECHVEAILSKLGCRSRGDIATYVSNSEHPLGTLTGRDAGVHRPGVTDAAPAEQARTLTRREREIAGLIADGATNAEIAARLFISERTVDCHVRKILAKLGCTGREQISPLLGRKPQAAAALGGRRSRGSQAPSTLSCSPVPAGRPRAAVDRPRQHRLPTTP